MVAGDFLATGDLAADAFDEVVLADVLGLADSTAALRLVALRLVPLRLVPLRALTGAEGGALAPASWSVVDAACRVERLSAARALPAAVCSPLAFVARPAAMRDLAAWVAAERPV